LIPNLSSFTGWHLFLGRLEVVFKGFIHQKPANRRLPASEYVWAVGIIGFTTTLALLLRPHLQTTDVAMLFLLAVVVIAYRHRRGPAVVASLLSIAVFDFGFVPPYYTFGVHDTAYFLTFAVMLGVALSMSQLTGLIREQAEEAREREHLATALYAMDRDLAGADNLKDQLAIVTRHIVDAGDGEVLVLLNQTHRESQAAVWPAEGLLEGVAVRVAATWAYEHGESAGWGTSRCGEAEALVVPLRSSTHPIGVVVLMPQEPDRILSVPERQLVESLVDQAAVVFERTMLDERHERARVEIESERLRTALLSSLSHDLRTPLSSIEGAASSLLQESGNLPDEARHELADTILQESRRMTRLVTNLLDMVRVEADALAVHKEWQPLEEALGVALLRLEERLAGHPIDTRLPATLPLVPIDELLIEQVFINLLENAAKHTSPGTRITISAWASDDMVVVEVADEGAGINPGDEEAIFRKFHRSSGTDHTGPAGGSGLGLTICRGIISAHGGRIWLEQNVGKGAAFRFTLPLDGPPRRALPDEAAEARA
jgi:two-component system, OmpR family, sensor histidine kinase KdpD